MHCLFPSPAPGSYDVEKVEKNVHQTSPAYSFGVKYKDHRQEYSPGNAYFTSSVYFKFLFIWYINICKHL